MTLCSYITEGTAVQVPLYVLQRDPAYFSPHPDSFLPERWLPQDDNSTVVVDRGAFIPFSHGPANCVGKGLAMLELRCLVTMFVMKFEMFFDDGYNPARWEEGLKDNFVLVKGELPVKLKLRKRLNVV